MEQVNEEEDEGKSLNLNIRNNLLVTKCIVYNSQENVLYFVSILGDITWDDINNIVQYIQHMTI